MSSLFGMNAVELTDRTGSGDDDKFLQSGPLPGRIVDFWPTTFVRQIVVMGKFPNLHLFPSVIF